MRLHVGFDAAHFILAGCCDALRKFEFGFLLGAALFLALDGRNQTFCISPLLRAQAFEGARQVGHVLCAELLAIGELGVAGQFKLTDSDLLAERLNKRLVGADLFGHTATGFVFVLAFDIGDFGAQRGLELEDGVRVALCLGDQFSITLTGLGNFFFADLRTCLATVISEVLVHLGIEGITPRDGTPNRLRVDTAASTARAYLPDPKDLQRAIQAATGDLGKQVYATQFEADRDRLLLAGKLSDLESISGDQLTEAEKQLKSLDGILENARQQIDALRGIDTSVLGVDARIAMLTDAILAERTARNAVKTGGGGGGGGLGGAGGPLMPGWANWGKGDWVVNQGGSLVADAATGTIYSQGGQQLFRSSLVNAATALIKAGQSMDVYDAIKQSGFTLAQADKVLGLQSGTAEDWAKAMGLPIFHTGTSYVPQTGLALLEQGERVIKASDNRALMASLQGGGVSTARLEAQLDQLLDDNRRQAGEIIRLQSQVAKLMSKWDDEGQPEEREAITA